MLAVIINIVIHCEGPWDGSATWPPAPTCYWRTKAPAGNGHFPSGYLPQAFFIIPRFLLYIACSLSLSQPLALFELFDLLFAKQANLFFSLLNFIILQMLMTVIPNTINPLQEVCKSIQIVSGLCII